MKKIERRPQITFGGSVKPANARRCKSWPATMRAISIGPRCTPRSANSTAPSGFVPNRVRRRPRPWRVRTGIRVRANTQGCPLHNRCTSRLHTHAPHRNPKALASSRLGRVRACANTRTRKRPAQVQRRRWVSEPGSNSQAGKPTGILRGNNRERGRQVGKPRNTGWRSADKAINQCEMRIITDAALSNGNAAAKSCYLVMEKPNEIYRYRSARGHPGRWHPVCYQP